MATTSGNLTMRNGGRHGRKAKFLAGLAALGCAAALAVGGLRPGDAAHPQPAVSAPVVAAQTRRSQQQFLERNLTLPTGTLPGAIVTQAQQRFLEQNRWLPSGVAPATVVPRAWQWFLEVNTNPPSEPPRSSAPADPRVGPLP